MVEGPGLIGVYIRVCQVRDAGAIPKRTARLHFTPRGSTARVDVRTR